MYGQVLMMGGSPSLDLQKYTLRLPPILHGLTEYLLDSYTGNECRWTIIKSKYLTHRALYFAAAQVIVLHLATAPFTADQLETWLVAALATAYSSGRVCPYIVILTAQPTPPWVGRLQLPYTTPLPLVILEPLQVDHPHEVRHFLHLVADMAWSRTARLTLQLTPSPLTSTPPPFCCLLN
jgi:hypothetical protein